MTLGALLKSCLARIDRFERAIDFDPIEAQAVRLSDIEANLADLAARQTDNQSRGRVARPVSTAAR